MAPEPGTPEKAGAEISAGGNPPPVDPPSVRLIHRLRDHLHGNPRRVVLTLVLLGVGVSMAGGFYKVENGEAAAVLRFGALAGEAVEPGLRFRWPWGMERVITARTGEVARREIADDDSDVMSLVTGDENLIAAELVVQYRIAGLRDYLFATENPELLIDQVVRATLVEAFVATPVDEVLTSAKAGIQNRVRTAAQERLDHYGAGITLVAVGLQSVNPPREAAGAFRAVSDARAEAAKEVNGAESERDRNQSLTRGEADRLLTEGRSAADARRRQAEGAAERFEALLAQARIAPRQTRGELYQRALREVLPRTRIVVLAPGESPRVALEMWEKGKRRGGVPPGRSFDDR